MAKTGGTELDASRAAGVLLFVGGAIFLAAIATCIAVAPYLLEDNNLSEFGIHDPTALIFNGAMVLVGTMTALAGWCFRGRWAPIVAALCIVGGGGMIAAGIVTVEVGKLAHAIFAGVDYAGHLLVTLVIARTLSGALRTAGFLAVGLSLVLLLLWVFQAPFLFDTIQQAGTQFLTTLPLVVWMFAYSGALLFARPHARRARVAQGRTPGILAPARRDRGSLPA